MKCVESSFLHDLTGYPPISIDLENYTDQIYMMPYFYNLAREKLKLPVPRLYDKFH